MKFSQTNQGRVFVIRLEDGEILHEKIEEFAREHSIKAASLMVLGCADKGSKLIVGPENGRGKKIVPLEYILDNVYEITGNGTIFPGPTGEPVLHMHIACGRKGSAKVGCVRNGVKVWHLMEIILTELPDSIARRELDKATGFELLNP